MLNKFMKMLLNIFIYNDKTSGIMKIEHKMFKYEHRVRTMYTKRREDILAMLKESSPLTVKEIAEQLLVSEMTIRRDLTQMEKEGMVKRSFGSVTLSPDGVQPEILQSALQRVSRASEAKRQIAGVAAELVKNGDSVILDVGTTVYELAKLLREKSIAIHTSSIPTALCANGGTADVWVSGGRMERSYEVLNGPTAERFYQNLYCDFAFVSAATVSCLYGLTAYTEDDAALKCMMLSRARKRVLLADAGKFNEIQQFRACGLDNVDIVITDSLPDEEYLDFLQQHQIQLIVTDSPAE